MADVDKYTFPHRELAEILVKRLDIHEGLWGIYVEFGLQGANIGTGDEDQLPVAIVSLLKLGLQKFSKPSNLTVDAAIVNPKVTAKPNRRMARKT